MSYQVGDLYQASTGECLEVMPFTTAKFQFRVLNPRNLEPTDFYLDGSLLKLSDWAESVGLEKITRETFKPKGNLKGPPA